MISGEIHVSQSFSHSVNSGGKANFKQVLECYSYNVFLSKLHESAYKPVYAVICTDGKVSLMSNMTARELK